MNETEAASTVEVRAAKPGARQYYVWSFAMSVIIVHTVLIIGVAGFGMGILSRYGRSFFARPRFSDFMSFASFLDRSPGLSMVAALILVPVAIVACYRKSVGKRAWVWLLSYWLMTGTALGLLVSARFILTHDFMTGMQRYSGPWNWGPWWRVWWGSWVRPSLVMCVQFFAPLPITILAALLTIGAGKRRPVGASEISGGAIHG
jgi:hypothetical protein